ncbi:MAG: hypothetical protein ACE5G1_09150 [bacterium]
MSPGENISNRRIDAYTLIALLVSLVVYPVLYSSGIMGKIVGPIFTENSRLHWWYFWLHEAEAA